MFVQKHDMFLEACRRARHLRGLWHFAPGTSVERLDAGCLEGFFTFLEKKLDTPWKFNIAPENKPSQKESNLQTIVFQGLC